MHLGLEGEDLCMAETSVDPKVLSERSESVGLTLSLSRERQLEKSVSLYFFVIILIRGCEFEKKGVTCHMRMSSE